MACVQSIIGHKFRSPENQAKISSIPRKILNSSLQTLTYFSISRLFKIALLLQYQYTSIAAQQTSDHEL